MRWFVLSVGTVTSALALIAAANAADLNTAEPMSLKDSPVYAPNIWTGFYAGVHLGGAAGTDKVSDPYGPSIFGDTIQNPGAIGGVQAGYNYQIGRLVAGVEAEFSAANMDGSSTCFAYSGYYISSNCHSHVDSIGTLTGRLGATLGAWERTLIYAKGGLAWENASISATANGNVNTATSASEDRTGWTLGAGVERALTPHWSVKAEYDYLSFGDSSMWAPVSFKQVALPSTFALIAGKAANTAEDVHEFKLGVNYRIGADAAAWTPDSDVSLKDAPTVLAYGWETEVGGRYWYSTGRFQKDLAPPSLVSRLSYGEDLAANSGEAFGRVDTPWNVFIKGNLGLGSIDSGHQNDEDWMIPPGVFGVTIPYSNTVAGKVDGDLSYATIDAGYDLLRGGDYKVGPFIGYSYWHKKKNAYGCMQIANPNSDCAGISVEPTSHLGIAEDDTWQALRVGFSAETMVTDRLKISADAAYLPYAYFSGQDDHLDRKILFPEWSDGGNGVQAEALLSYALTDRISVGVGGRYWAAWTAEGRYSCAGCITAAADYKTERAGVFAQTSYKFGAGSPEPLK